MMGSILRCSFPVTKGAARHACIIAIKDNKMGAIPMNRSRLHHVIVLIALLRFSVNLMKEICPRGNNKVIIYFLIS